MGFLGRKYAEAHKEAALGFYESSYEEFHRLKEENARLKRELEACCKQKEDLEEAMKYQ